MSYDISISGNNTSWYRDFNTLIAAKKFAIDLLLTRHRIHPRTFGSQAPSVILRKLGKARHTWR